jgi:hypothetical protein
MYIKKGKGPAIVTLPDGTKMSRSDLPPADTSRWVASRKALVVRAILSGLIDTDEACTLYSLSVEEVADWTDKVRAHGDAALKATAVKKYRQL